MRRFFVPSVRIALVLAMACAVGAWPTFAKGEPAGGPDAQVVRAPKGPMSPVFGQLPAEFTVQAVGTYAGLEEVEDVQLDDSANTVRQAEVVVNQPGKAVVLILTAYDPTVWRVGRTRNTQLLGVLVSGYHGQALIGIDKKVPHAVTSHETKKTPWFYAYKASPGLLAMNDVVKRLIGREIDRFENRAVNGVFHVGEPPNDPADVVYSDDLRVEKFVVDPARPPAGAKGLDQLVKEGKLRQATQADIDAWVEKASEKYKRFNPELRVDAPMRPDTTYVVLKELTLPDGLYGGHSRSFILGDAIPFPAGPPAHNRFYRTDGTEEGPMAGHGDH